VDPVVTAQASDVQGGYIPLRGVPSRASAVRIPYFRPENWYESTAASTGPAARFACFFHDTDDLVLPFTIMTQGQRYEKM
jgi:hypothetical protein